MSTAANHGKWLERFDRPWLYLLIVVMGPGISAGFFVKIGAPTTEVLAYVGGTALVASVTVILAQRFISSLSAAILIAVLVVEVILCLSVIVYAYWINTDTGAWEFRLWLPVILPWYALLMLPTIVSVSAGVGGLARWYVRRVKERK